VIDKRRWITRLTGGRLLLKGSTGNSDLFLTFDDGPHAEHTPRLLDLLARHSVRATFFLVGREAHAHPQLASAIADQGHELGNHTLAHLRMDRLSDRARLLEIRGMESALARMDGRDSHYFRPPYGAITLDLVRCCFMHGIRIALWSRDSHDYKGDFRKVVDGFREKPPQAGDILLFHDDSDTAIRALEVLLPAWIAAGFSFKTLSQMSRSRGKEPA
jgi:peptidoglycan/xylan/chitin deacetylase (PgdA/CDA1 family)